MACRLVSPEGKDTVRAELRGGIGPPPIVKRVHIPQEAGDDLLYRCLSCHHAPF
jgi:hypothetical protein